MEFLGNIFDTPKRTKKGWNWINVEYADQEKYLDGTSKALSILNNDGKCVVTENSGDKYILEIHHAKYDTLNNVISVFPYDCRKIS
jgi:hypothetical protein